MKIPLQSAVPKCRMRAVKTERGERILLSSASSSPLLPLLSRVRGGVEGDVVVRSWGGEAIAHKVLLAAASPLLRLALDELAEEGDERVVVVVEEEQEEVDNLLDLLYTGTARQTHGLIQLLLLLRIDPGKFTRDSEYVKASIKEPEVIVKEEEEGEIEPPDDLMDYDIEKQEVDSDSDEMEKETKKEKNKITKIKKKKKRVIELKEFMGFQDSDDDDSSDSDEDEEWNVKKKNITPKKKSKEKQKESKTTKQSREDAEEGEVVSKQHLQEDEDEENDEGENTRCDTTITNEETEALLKLLQENPSMKFIKVLELLGPMGKSMKGKKECLICDKMFQVREEWISHKISHERGPNTLGCEECDYKTNTILTLRTHIQKNHAEKDILCPLCGDYCADGAEFKKHRNAVHRKLKFKRHKKTPYKDQGENGERLVCDTCAKSFASKSSLVNHIKMQHGNPKLWKCEKCGSNYKSFAHYSAHVILHEAPTVLCLQCGKKFHTQSNLERHEKSQHMDEKDMDFHCSQCGKGFMTTQSLEGHMNMHLGLKPYKCRYCNNCYQNHSNCYAHERKSHPDLFVRNTKVQKRLKTQDYLL